MAQIKVYNPAEETPEDYRALYKLACKLYSMMEKRGGRIAELEAENKRLRTALNATWDALDGLYGADAGEETPINLLPEDRQQLFHKALELVGEVLNGGDDNDQRPQDP